MRHQEDGVGFADHPVPHLNVTSMPVGQPCPHHGHAQLGIVGMVELPVWTQHIIVTDNPNLPYICTASDHLPSTLIDVVHLLSHKCCEASAAHGAGLSHREGEELPNTPHGEAVGAETLPGAMKPSPPGQKSQDSAQEYRKRGALGDTPALFLESRSSGK